MPIPNHEEIRIPALTIMNKYANIKYRELEILLAETFSLTDEEKHSVYDSSDKKVFSDRIIWSLKSLLECGLVELKRRNFYSITDMGRKVVSDPSILSSLLKTKQKNRNKDPLKLATDNHNNQATPREHFDVAVKSIKTAIHKEILDEILRKSPRAFEELVVKLLQKMGYGGAIESSGRVTSYSNDHGIDGIIKEDVLGLGCIHIQAKRYALDRSISREDIQKFVGALAPATSNKGVFITTSKYTKGAQEYAKKINGSTSLVLIDGEMLAQYIYQYNLGMTVEQTVEIKKLDSDFWNSLQDEEISFSNE